MPKKRPDLKQKEKRQKIIAAVGAVLLLGLLGFQIPRTLKLMNSRDTVANPEGTTAASTTPAAGVPLAPPSLDGSSAATAVASGSAVSDPYAKPTPGSGQLLSFAAPRFKAHNPFVQQVGTSGDGSATPATSGGATTGTGGATGATGPSGITPPRTTGGSGGTSVPTLVATISVNGVAERVAVGATFPRSNPIFRLVRATQTTVDVSIVGGSYTSGQSTVTLSKGKPVTLMNSADGTRYELRLLAVS
jgi:hypothetical protein